MAKAPSKEQPTASERALAAVSQSQWTDYVERFRPAEAAMIKKAQLTEGERAQVKGEVAADTAAAFKGLSRDTVAKGAQSGANVSSGKTKLSLAGDAIAQGEVRGVGQAVAETGAEIDAEQQKLRIVGHGRQVATDVTSNLSRGAQRATSLALAASQARFQRNLDTVDAVASVAGAATRKLNKPKKFLSQADADAVDYIDLDIRPRGI